LEAVSIRETPQPADAIKGNVVADDRLAVIAAETGDPVIIFPEPLAHNN
jgi:hypothetical protein